MRPETRQTLTNVQVSMLLEQDQEGDVVVTTEARVARDGGLLSAPMRQTTAGKLIKADPGWAVTNRDGSWIDRAYPTKTEALDAFGNRATVEAARFAARRTA